MKRALTNTAVKNAKAEARNRKIADGGGLYLLVTANGSKLWRYKHRLHGKEQTFSIGSYPEVTLAQARELHEAARKLVSEGRQPTLERKQFLLHSQLAAQNTFSFVASQWIASRSPHWSAYYLRQVRSTFDRDVLPSLGALPIETVRPVLIRPVLLDVAARTSPPDGKKDRGRGATSVAILIRMWISALFRYASAHGHDVSDPTTGLRDMFKRPKVQHHRHLAESELAGFLKALNESKSARWTKLAVELLLLTFVRTGELRRAEWSEFDLDGRLWRIPAEKMKMRRPHLVPLSNAALQRLAELRALSGHQPFLFPNQRRSGAVMTATTINRLIERMGYAGKVSGHGFRGTASTLLNERGFLSRVIEKQLAHERGSSVEFSYNHAEYLDERRAMMEAWAAILFDNGLV